MQATLPTVCARLACLAIALSALLGGSVNAANLIVNGDFSGGNSGFASGYRFTTTNLVPDTTYAVATDPHDLHPGAFSFGDHTSGSGKMFLANGPSSPNVVVWKQTVAVFPASNYEFSAWIASWGNANGYDPSPANLRFEINGVQIGGTFVAPSADAVFSQFTAGWVSNGNTLATIAIINDNIQIYGNDFAMDNISLSPTSPVVVPETHALALLGFGLAGIGVLGRRKTW